MAGKKTIEEWEAMFKEADKDNSNTLDILELRDLLRAGNSNVTDSQIADAFVYLDGGPTGDKIITLEEFVKGMQSFETFFVKLAEHFKEYDTDGNGFLDKEELRKMLNSCGHEYTDQEVNIILEQADTSGDGKISFQEFLKVCT